MAGETVVSTTDPLTHKLFSVSLMADSVRQSVFLSTMSETASTQRQALAKRQRVQSMSHHMPIVTINDLTMAAGDRVSCDLYHILNGMPTMGDEVIEGRSSPLSFDSMDVIINQSRKAVSPGARMTQKRTSHNLRQLARANLVNYFGRLADQRIMIHLAGARGMQNDDDWVIPLDNHDRFADIMINPVEPPTTNRYFVAGGGTTPADLGTSDALTLEDLDVISAKLREMPFPPAPIQVSQDKNMQDAPFWCLMLSERQWHYIVTRAKTDGNTWRKFVADAAMRASITKHPLFLGETGMWNGFLVKRAPRTIRFDANSTVRLTSSDDGTISSHTTPVATDRAILLGGQALAIAYGSGRNQNLGAYPTTWSEKLMDHGNSIEVAAGQILGTKKIVFDQTDRKKTDFGVIAIDSYAPDPASAAGITLRNALQS